MGLFLMGRLIEIRQKSACRRSQPSCSLRNTTLRVETDRAIAELVCVCVYGYLCVSVVYKHVKTKENQAAK